MPHSVVGRVGRWCSRHWQWVLAAWVVAVVAGGLATGPLFARLADGGPPASVESVAVNSVLNAGNHSGGVIYGVVSHVDAHAPVVADATNRSADELVTLKDVAEVAQPFA